MPKPLTTGRALAQQRRNIKRKIESLNMKLATDIHLVVRKHLKRLADWIGQSDERYQARPGGLGTVNKGASETRLTIVREIQRMNKDRPIGLPDNIAKELIGFIRSMDEQKPGGLGGRRK